MQVMSSLFELVYNYENAFHITMNHFYTIDFTNTPEILSILGFESSVRERTGQSTMLLSEYLVLPRSSYERTLLCVLSIPSGYDLYLEFIEAVG